jgi:hypothetical protein
MPSARIGALAILCACGTSPWDPAIVDEGGDLPLDVELPFEIATIEGDDDDPLYGFASRLSAVGDFDADGFPDIAAVTQYEDVVVALGGGRPPSFVSDLRANDRGFVIVPETDDWFSIGDIEGAVDFDGDGDQDLVVGVEQVEIAPTHFVNRAYIVFGGARPAAPIRLADIAAGRGGVLLEGFGVAGVSGVGDLDGDGRDELALVGPPVLEQAPVWTAHILRGRDDTALLRQADFTDEVDGFVIRSADPALSLGRVDACGDVDGDGLDDLLVSGLRSTATRPSASPSSCSVRARLGASGSTPISPRRARAWSRDRRRALTRTTSGRRRNAVTSTATGARISCSAKHCSARPSWCWRSNAARDSISRT